MTLAACVRLLAKGVERRIEVRAALGQKFRGLQGKGRPRGRLESLAVCRDGERNTLTPPISSRVVNVQVLRSRIADEKERRKFWNWLS